MIIEKWAFATYFDLESSDPSVMVSIQDWLVVRMLTDPAIKNCMKDFLDYSTLFCQIAGAEIDFIK